MAMVETAKEYIRAGEAFQVLPSMRMRIPFKLPPFSLYRALRRLNPSPFLFFLDFGNFSVVGSSPEILVRVRDGKVTIRPLAGDAAPRRHRRRRQAARTGDAEPIPKERAEHLMLVDLARNDVGRVSRIGTVKVTESFVIERYSHVMHICSNVEGDLDPKYDALGALIAGFPAGTLSGAPKVRAMEIIDELELERRNIYGGSIGNFAGDGSMDTCLVLRTAIVKDGVRFAQAGGGVVVEQQPRRRIPGSALDKMPRSVRRHRGGGQFYPRIAGGSHYPLGGSPHKSVIAINLTIAGGEVFLAFPYNSLSGS